MTKVHCRIGFPEGTVATRNQPTLHRCTPKTPDGCPDKRSRPMTRRHLMTLRILLMLGDGVSAAVVFLVVSILRFEPEGGAQWSVGVHPGLFALAFALTWIGVFWALGMYRLRVRWSMTAEARDIAKATLVAVAVTLSLLFVLHQDNVSRLFLAILFVVQPTVTLASRAL